MASSRASSAPGPTVAPMAFNTGTLATKQHLLIDVLAGAALGLAGGWWSVRASRSSKQRVQ